MIATKGFELKTKWGRLEKNQFSFCKLFPSGHRLVETNDKKYYFFIYLANETAEKL